MIRIENISVSEKYSISLWFNKDYTKENFIFSNEDAKQAYFRNRSTEGYEIVNKKRNFGTIIEDGLAIAESDNLRAIKTAVSGLAGVLKQGKGNSQAESYRTELFRIYNGSDNILEQYVILKLWHEFTVKHREENSRIYSTRPQWEKIGGEYQTLADKMLMPFEKKFTSADDVRARSGQARIETLITEKEVECVYTFDEDILPLYVMYMTELARQGKHIRECEICGRLFVASRKDTKVCGAKCKSQRQAGYFKEHKEKYKEDFVYQTFEQNRDGYGNYIKKLQKIDNDDITREYISAKDEFLDEGKKKKDSYYAGNMTKGAILEWIRADRKKRMDLEEKINKKLDCSVTD